MRVKTVMLIILGLMFMCSAASAEYILVKSMDEYGDGVYENTANYVGATSSSERQVIQPFQVSENISIDRIAWYNPTAANNPENITYYNVTLYQAFSDTIDYNLRPDKILFSGTSTDMGVGEHYLDLPASIELKSGLWYCVQFLYDRDGIYSNNEGLEDGKTGYVYFAADSNGTQKMLLKGISWSVSTRMLDIRLYKNDDLIHSTGLPDYSSTSTDVSVWEIAPTLDKPCNSELLVNGESIGWQNNTDVPTWTITIDDINQYGNNVVTILSFYEETSLNNTFYLDRTVGVLISENTPLAGTVAVDNTGNLWIFGYNKTYYSPDGGITYSLVSTASGFPGVAQSSRCFQVGDVWFGTRDGQGVWKSDDGITWTKVLDGDFFSWDIIGDDRGGVYASRYQQTSYNSSVFKSVDGGNTWEIIFDPLARHVHGMGFVNGEVVVCVGDKAWTPNAVGVWKSSDYGATWTQTAKSTQMTAVSSIGQYGILGGDDNSQGIVLISDGDAYSSAVFNDAYKNPIYEIKYDSIKNVLVGSMYADFGGTYRGIVVSGDGGKSWRYLTNKIGRINDVSSDGYIYFRENDGTMTKLVVPTASAINELPLMTDLYADNAIVTKQDSAFYIDETFGEVNIKLYGSELVDIRSQGNQFSISHAHGSINMKSDTLLLGNSVIKTDGYYYTNVTMTPRSTLVNPPSIVPYVDDVEIYISSWSSTQKVWTLSSETQQSVTHTIGGFPADTNIDIYRDGVDYATVRSNSTGYITWVYDGGFSEHEFEAIVHPTAGVTSDVRDSFVSSWGNTVSMVGAIIVIALAGSMIMMFRGKKDLSEVMNDLPGILLIVVMLVVGAIIFGQF